MAARASGATGGIRRPRLRAAVRGLAGSLLIAGCAPLTPACLAVARVARGDVPRSAALGSTDARAVAALGATDAPEGAGGKARRPRESLVPPAGSALESVLELEQGDACAGYHWQQYCKTEAGGLTNPWKHSEGFLEDFLTRYKKGEFPKIEIATGAMVETVLDMQGVPATGWPWLHYCATEGAGTRDPRRLPADFVRRFVDEYETGSRPRVEMVAREAADRLGLWQKREGKYARETWFKFATKHGCGIKDPRYYPAALLEKFFEDFHPRPVN